MEELFGSLFYIIIALIWIVSMILKARGKKGGEVPPSEEEVEEYFRTIGLPPQELPTRYEPTRPEVPLPPKREPIRPQPAEAKRPIPKVKAPEIKKEIKKEPLLPKEVPVQKIPPLAKTLTKEQLQEGIILSTILGPPRAHRNLRRYQGSRNL